MPEPKTKRALEALNSILHADGHQATKYGQVTTVLLAVLSGQGTTGHFSDAQCVLHGELQALVYPEAGSVSTAIPGSLLGEVVKRLSQRDIPYAIAPSDVVFDGQPGVDVTVDPQHEWVLDQVYDAVRAGAS